MISVINIIHKIVYLIDSLTFIHISLVYYILSKLKLINKADIKKPEESIILITGCSSGIGLYTSLELATLGYTVFAGIRKEKDNQQLKTKSKLGKIIPIILDINSEEDIKSALNVISKYQSENKLILKAIIFNAGIASLMPIECVNLESLNYYMDPNYSSTLNLFFHFLPLIKQNLTKLIFIGSIASFGLKPCFGIYSASKAALKASVLIMRTELRKSNIDVTILELGGIKTNIYKNLSSFELTDKVKGIDTSGKLIYAKEPNFVVTQMIRNQVSFTKDVELFGTNIDHVFHHIKHCLNSGYTLPVYYVGTDAKVLGTVWNFCPYWFWELAIYYKF